MALSARRSFAWVIVLAGCLLGCTTKDPLYCDSKTPCAPGKVCNNTTRTCEPAPSPDGRGPETGLPDGASDLGGRELGRKERGTGDAGKLPPGGKCKSADECDSGFCVENVCCENACSATCKSCALAGTPGACKLVPSGQDPRKQCTGKDAACAGSCDGNGACTFAATDTKGCAATTCSAGTLTLSTCNAGACTTTQSSCGGYACDATGKCKTGCTTTAADCYGTAQCNSSSKCVSSLPLGDPCGTNNDACASKVCVDGVCCESSCTGTCQSCALSGSKGTCKPIPDTQDPDKECQGADPVHCAGTCNGLGACNLSVKNGVSCAPDQCSGITLTRSACSSGACVPVSAPCPSYFACEPATNKCKTSCTKATQASDCAPSYFCTDGVCCQTASCSACQRCNLTPQGICTAVPNGTTTDCEKSDCSGTCKSGGCDFSGSNGSGCGTDTCNPPSCAGHTDGTCQAGACVTGPCC